MLSTPLLQLLPGLLWSGEVVPGSVLFMSQIEVNFMFMLN